MVIMAEKLKQLDITKDELERIGKALKNEEFRNLLVEYCEEITNPETRKQYEEEITQLERERGVEVTFINPRPGYVIKTSSIDGNKLAFLNICSNEHVEKATSEYTARDGSHGQQWSLPHLLSPPREDINKTKKRCTVYDVIFHPDTLKLGLQNTQFRNMVNNIACEAIESNFDIHLDKSNLKFPKLQYKGMSRPVVIRKKTNQVEKKDEEDRVDKLYSDLYKQMDEHYIQNSTKPVKSAKPESKEHVENSKYATPKYLIKHRTNIDIQDFTNDPNCKLNVAIPKELLVEVNLPLLKSAADLTLDITEKTLSLISEKPSKYKLNLTLPYAVDENAGSARFVLDERKLIVTLPVKMKSNLLLSDIGRYDSGVDSDTSPLAESVDEKSAPPLIEELTLQDDSVDESECNNAVQSERDVFRTTIAPQSFLSPDVCYTLPEYSCHLFDNILSFTLHVKNVNSNSLVKQYNESATAVHIKFSSISSGFFPVNYAFFIRLIEHCIATEDVLIEAWDNNVIVQIPYKPCDEMLSAYFVGTDEHEGEDKLIQEPSIINTKFIQSVDEAADTEYKPTVDVRLNSDDELTIVVNPEAATEDARESVITNSMSIIKSRSFSESSCDELLSTSQSPSKSKGILKNRLPLSRSISESSVDDCTWSSIDNCAEATDSQIPEEGEVSSSMKKTVRFNDVVSRQLFRSNSSILGQRKKNRKYKSKKRAQQRRASESENSEGEDRKDKKPSEEKSSTDAAPAEYEETRNANAVEEITQALGDKIQIDFKNDLIFDLDM